METLAAAFEGQIKKAMSISKVPTVITKDNVYQEGDINMLPILDEMAGTLLLSGSGIDGMENLEELLSKAKAGKSCLLMLEHYSNFDLSVFSLLVRQAGGDAIANALISIAGMKLNEDNPVVAAFASAYTRIVIYPSRSLHGLDSKIKKTELARSMSINRAAMKILDGKKTEGKLILVFPSGTRYRAWNPSTKKGVREIDSYIRSFDYMCCVAINGMILHVQQTDMMNDIVNRDLVRITVGPVLNCNEFRAKARNAIIASENEDKKQLVVDAVMAELESLHTIAEIKRQKQIDGGKG
ncbi:MAG: 1-acyl-sn-glycerol-3-phosphate acyltransferase [Treponema sp.]|nr:1-acyl-sn-glycerol-3-phosphate acyltransferase [Treponema sp.]